MTPIGSSHDMATQGKIIESERTCHGSASFQVHLQQGEEGNRS